MKRLRPLWETMLKTWRESKTGKVVMGCAGLVFLCALCAVCGWLFSFTPQYQESARRIDGQNTATALARVALANATATEKAKPTHTALPTETAAPSRTPQPTDAPDPTEPRAPTLDAAPTQNASPADALQKIARAKFKAELMDAHIADVLGKNIVTVDYDLGVQWDENTAVFSAQDDFITFAPQVFKAADVDALELRAFSDFKDALGNTKKEVAVKFTLSRALADKINWTGILPTRLGDALATDETSGVYVHPSLRAAWNNSQR